ncbi:MAG: 2-amino-4-hydroxy-6-hydroxymethyldihydropteridine diphosphokinase [Planctomycetota bacterium]
MFPNYGDSFDVRRPSAHDAGMHRTAIVALGSNVGDRLAHLRSAAAAVRALPGVRAFRASRLYETPALTLSGVGALGGRDAFLNAAIAFETNADPHGLLHDLLSIEKRHGRLPRSQRPTWGPRPIDLDLLTFGDVQIDDTTLTLPHPRIAERWFVLAPMADLVPEARLRVDDSTEGWATVQERLAWMVADADDPSGLGRVYADASWSPPVL